MARVVIDKPKTIAYTQKVTRRHVKKTVDEIFLGAKRLVPKGTHLSGSGELSPDVPLGASLKSNVKMTVDLVTGTVGSDANWAATVHQGSKPHRIYSKKGRILKFEWERGMARLTAQGRRTRGRSRIHTRRFFFFAEVRHPGNKRPVRYLTTPMHQYGRMNGFRTTSMPVSRTRLP